MSHAPTRQQIAVFSFRRGSLMSNLNLEFNKAFAKGVLASTVKITIGQI
jgi:hypothetical protein